VSDGDILCEKVTKLEIANNDYNNDEHCRDDHRS